MNELLKRGRRRAKPKMERKEGKNNTEIEKAHEEKISKIGKTIMRKRFNDNEKEGDQWS